MKVGQVTFTGGELAPALYARVDLQRFNSGLKLCRNWIVRRFGGVSNRPGFEFICPLRHHDAAPRFIAFSYSTTQTYVLIFEDQQFRIVKDDGVVLESSQSITSVSLASPGVVTKVGHGYSDGDDLYYSSMGGMTQLEGRFLRVNYIDADSFSLLDIDGVTAVDTSSYTAFTSGSMARVYEVTTPWLSADLDQLKFVQDANTLTVTHVDYVPKDVTRSGHTSWTVTSYQTAPVIQPPTNVAGNGTDNIDYVVTSISDETGENSVASSPVTGKAAGNVTWSAPGSGPTPDRYAVYARNNGGVYGFIGMSTGLSFDNTADISPDYTDTPALARTLFDDSDEYPGCAIYYEQRLMFGRSNDAPDTISGSATGLRRNFNRSIPTKDDDSVTFTLAAAEVDAIEHMVSSTDLVVLTSGAEWRLKGVGDSSLSPTSVDAKPQTYHGSSHVRPLVIDNDILYIQKGQTTVRSFTFTLELDGYDGDELSVLANHLFEGNKIIDWCWAEEPLNVIWCVLEDGRLAGCTFDAAQEIIGWHQHATNYGRFEACASVYDDVANEDVLYVAVHRSVGGVTRRYVERLATRIVPDARCGVFVDSAVTLDAPLTVTDISTAGVFTVTSHGLLDTQRIEVDATEWLVDVGDDDSEPPLDGYKFLVANATTHTFTLTDLSGVAVDTSSWPIYSHGGEVRAHAASVSGLWHLEGATVAILNDGNVEPEQVVTNGAITLANTGARVHIGIPIRGADIKPLPFSSQRVEARMQTVTHTINEVTLRVEKTRGLKVGPDAANLYPFKERDSERWDSPIELTTGDLDTGSAGPWQSFTDMLIRQPDPLPATILALIPDIIIGQ